MFEDNTPRYSEGAGHLSPLLMKHGFQLSDEKLRSHRKKHSSREEDAAVSRRELNEIKRQHEKELKNLLKFLENESSLMNGIEEEKREELYELKRQHEKEVKKLFDMLEKELTVATERHSRKQTDLEDRLERSQVEAHEEMRRYKEHALTWEDELQSLTQQLQSTKQKSQYEMRKLMDELGMSTRQTSSLENEVILLSEKLAEKDQQIRQLEGMNSKSSYVEEELRDEIRRRDEELRRKDRAIMLKNEEIRSLNSKAASAQKQVETVNINGCKWEETSGLTLSSDFDIRKDPSEHYRDKPPVKYGLSPDRGRKTSHSSPIRRDNRDDLENRRKTSHSSSIRRDNRDLNVSFSDETETRLLPMDMHDNLSRRLEKMYLDH